MAFGGGGDSGGGQAMAEEAERQARIKQGMSAIETNFADFTPEFYDTRRKAYTDWAMPQVSEQYDKAREDLTFALARQYGTLDTSEKAKRTADLAKQYARAQGDVGSAGLDYATAAQKDVETQRNALVSQLQATSDPAAAAAAAMRSSQTLNAPNSFSPLGELFAGVTEGLAGGTAPYGGVDYYSGMFGGKKRPASPSGAAANYVTS